MTEIMQVGQRVKTKVDERWWLGFNVPANTYGTIIEVTEYSYIVKLVGFPHELPYEQRNGHAYNLMSINDTKRGE